MNKVGQISTTIDIIGPNFIKFYKIGLRKKGIKSDRGFFLQNWTKLGKIGQHFTKLDT